MGTQNKTKSQEPGEELCKNKGDVGRGRRELRGGGHEEPESIIDIYELVQEQIFLIKDKKITNYTNKLQTMVFRKLLSENNFFTCEQ